MCWTSRRVSTGNPEFTAWAIWLMLLPMRRSSANNSGGTGPYLVEMRAKPV